MRSRVIVGGILLAVAPWLSVGRDPVALVISVLGLTASLFLLWRQPQPRRTTSWLLQLVVAVWLGWGALSILWSVNRYDSELWLLYALVGVLVFVTTANLDQEEKAALLGGYVWIATATALYGLYLYATADYGRLTSSFYWANPAAAFLLPAVFWAGWGWLKRPDRAGQWGLLQSAQVIIVGTSVWLTDSRGALLAALLALLLAVAVAPGLRRRWLGLVGIAVLSFGLATGAAALRSHLRHQPTVAPGSRFAQAASGESISLQDRLNYLGSAVDIWQHHPLLGTGAGTYGVVHPQYQQRVISASNDAHNLAAQTLAEQGLLGVLWLAYLAILLGWGMGRGVRREPALAAAAVGAVAVAFHFGLDIDDRYPSLTALLALLAGVCYQPWQMARLVPSRRLAAPVLLAVALVLAIGAYESSIWANRGRLADANLDFAAAADSYAQAHSGPVYDPTTWVAEGIDYYTLASLTGGSRTYGPRAESAAQQAIQRDPADSQNYQLLARVKRLEGKPGQAETALDSALRLDRWNHPDYYSDLAIVQLQENKVAAAQRTISAGLALYPDAVIANRSADTTVKPAVAELLALQAADRLSRGDRSSAAADVKRALRLDPLNADAKQLQGSASLH